MTHAPIGIAAIETRLRERLQPSVLRVTDDSHLHAGHAGAGSGGHYTVEIWCAAFKGLSRVAQHRLVYDALTPWMNAGIHALAVRSSPPPPSMS